MYEITNQYEHCSGRILTGWVPPEIFNIFIFLSRSIKTGTAIQLHKAVLQRCHYMYTFMKIDKGIADIDSHQAELNDLFAV